LDCKKPTRYKLAISKEKPDILPDILKEETTSKILAKMLWGKPKTEAENIYLNTKPELIRNYHIALIKEKSNQSRDKKISRRFH
jgi:hypothetical protein